MRTEYSRIQTCDRQLNTLTNQIRFILLLNYKFPKYTLTIRSLSSRETVSPSTAQNSQLPTVIQPPQYCHIYGGVRDL
jgi:hypothetical protein